VGGRAAPPLPARSTRAIPRDARARERNGQDDRARRFLVAALFRGAVGPVCPARFDFNFGAKARLLGLSGNKLIASSRYRRRSVAVGHKMGVREKLWGDEHGAQRVVLLVEVAPELREPAVDVASEGVFFRSFVSITMAPGPSSARRSVSLQPNFVPYSRMWSPPRSGTSRAVAEPRPSR
jgi:hypothetical protein